MSASKENIQRGVFLSKHRRSLKNLYQSSNFYNTIQNGFSDFKLLRKASQGTSMQASMTNFHKTIAVGESSEGWVRPQSKHANRNVPGRPQTSKGSRKQPCQNNMMIFSSIIKKQQTQQIPSTLHKTATGKKIFKRGSNIHSTNKQCQQQERNLQLGNKLMMFNNWERYEPWRERSKITEDNDDNKEDVNIHEEDIEIVVNRRVNNEGQCKISKALTKKGPSMHRNKFETDLDDEFLELFAD